MKIEANHTDERSTGKDRFPEVTTTEEGIPIIIRPIGPEDKSRVAKLLRSLSPRSIYLRFFCHMRDFPDPMIHRLTHIDSRNEIVLVALDLSGNMLGKSTVCVMGDEKHAEFAVLVADDWQGKGIGAALLKRCLMLAKARGIETVWGRVLGENTQMLALGKKLGFVRRRVPDSCEYDLLFEMNKPA